jgi:hypothetical protein
LLHSTLFPLVKIVRVCSSIKGDVFGEFSRIYS